MLSSCEPTLCEQCYVGMDFACMVAAVWPEGDRTDMKCKSYLMGGEVIIHNCSMLMQLTIHYCD